MLINYWIKLVTLSDGCVSTTSAAVFAICNTIFHVIKKMLDESALILK